jgi:hypothetical protein
MQNQHTLHALSLSSNREVVLGVHYTVHKHYTLSPSALRERWFLVSTVY